MSDEVLVVRINDQSPTIQLSLQACAGLLNRKAASVYTILRDDRDCMWRTELGITNMAQASASDLLSLCLNRYRRRCVVYSHRLQQAILPNILTLAAVNDAIPVEEGDVKFVRETLYSSSSSPLPLDLIDARHVFRAYATPVLATEHLYETCVGSTTALAMLNPGYRTWNCLTPWNPPLGGYMDTSMVDWVFKERLFVVFLINSGIPCTASHRLMNRIARDNPWGAGDLMRVYGYADHWHVFSGFLFEAHTRLTTCYNMGAIPTAGAANLSFFSSMRSEIKPGELKQNYRHTTAFADADADADAGAAASGKVGTETPDSVAYDPRTTYVAFVVGDGDNVAYLLDQRARWIRERRGICSEKSKRSNGRALPTSSPLPSSSSSPLHPAPPPPLTWTISPHLARLAPKVLEWYYSEGRNTRADSFMLPPSGHLYSYPTSMRRGAQRDFVEATERDARLLDTSSTVHWDWFTSWRRAESTFLPGYGRVGSVRGIFPSNVPFLFPTLTWRKRQFFKVLRGDNAVHPVVLFRPREWRGIDGDNSGSWVAGYYRPSPKRMAEELASYPRGTVAYVYMSSDEGLRLTNSFMELERMLPEHVQLVSADTATTLALQASELGSKKPTLIS